MKNVIKLSDERIIAPSGLTFVESAHGKSNLVKRANKMAPDNKRSPPQFKNEDILLSYIGLIYQGRTCFDFIRKFHDAPD